MQVYATATATRDGRFRPALEVQPGGKILSQVKAMTFTRSERAAGAKAEAAADRIMALPEADRARAAEVEGYL